MSLERSGQPEAGEWTLPEQEYDGYVVNQGEQHDRDVSDLVLDVPVLKVDELNLEVEDLRAHVSLRAELTGLVKVTAGIDAYLDKVKLGIKGVEAQALLTVSLERVLNTLNRALDAVNRNPQILLGEAARGAGQTGREGDETERAADGPTGKTGKVYATDAARRRAAELGVELSEVKGTGSGGRILVKDVEKTAG